MPRLPVTPELHPRLLTPLLTDELYRLNRMGSGAKPPSSLTSQVQALFGKYAGKGGMWDFTDTATLFQDSAGAPPVTAAGQSVGLALDQLRRGEEILIPQPAFTMSPSVTRSGDVLTFASSASGDQASAATSVINSTKVYRLKITVTGTGSVLVYIGAAPVLLGAGSHDVPAWCAAGASNYIFRANTGGFNGTVAIEGLWELPGNHVIQSVAGKRPQYNGAGITPDGVDDFMMTASIDFTGCDKAVVAMGYTKLDSTARAQVELSNNPGASYCFWLSNGPDYFNQSAAFRPGGNAGFTSAVPNEYGAHIGRGAIKPGLGEVWWNAAKATNVTGNPNATLTFGNYPLYFLSRGGTSKFSNTPARRAFVMGIPVAGPQVSDDDLELIRLWLMEGA